MNPDDPNIQLLESVIYALGPLSEEVILVGGCAVGLLITDLARPPVRATRDVDLLLEVATKGDYYTFGEKLRERGFQEHVGDVMCRWRLRDLIVDVMPTVEDILNFGNRWYPEAAKKPSAMKLPSGNEIAVISPPLFLATKIEAFYGRGDGDFTRSHDLEDIVNIVDGRAELVDEILSADDQLRDYLRSEIDEFLEGGSLVEALPFHFAGDDINQQRVPIVIARLRAIAGL